MGNFDWSNPVSSLAGGVVGAISNAIGAKKQFKRQKQLMKLQNQYQIEQWERENEYNSPLAQLNRLEDAGINPLTQDGGFANTSGSIGGVSLPQAPSPDLSGFGQGISDAAQMMFAQQSVDNDQKRIDIEQQRLLNETNQAIANVASLNSKTALTDEERLNLIEQRRVIVQNADYIKAQYKRTQVQNQVDLMNAYRQYIEMEIDARYKAGMLDIEGQRNDISREANSIKREELKQRLLMFNKELDQRVKEFKEQVRMNKFDNISTALDKFEYDSVLGVNTGVNEESLITGLALMSVIPDIDFEYLSTVLPQSSNSDDAGSTAWKIKQFLKFMNETDIYINGIKGNIELRQHTYDQ